MRTFALDDIRDIEWMKGSRFEYPADYDPAKIAPGAFGLVPGPATNVRIFFTDKVARYVRRRLWHPSQNIRRVKAGIELAMVLSGTTELVSWVLSFGREAELLEPQSLRDELAREAAGMRTRYRVRPRRAEAPRSSGQKPAASS